MNKEDTKKAIEVMQAYVDGGEVELRSVHETTNWHAPYSPDGTPSWNLEFRAYRIKPKPREWEVLLDKNDWTMTIRQPGVGGRRWIKVREVI